MQRNLHGFFIVFVHKDITLEVEYKRYSEGGFSLFTSEIKDTALIAIGLILLASFLTFVSFMVGVRSDLSAIQEDRLQAKSRLQNHYEFNRYIESEQYGVDVISTIREYYDTNTKVGVKDELGNIVYEIDSTTAKTNPLLVDNTELAKKFVSTDLYDVVLVYEDKPLSSITKSYTRPSNAPLNVFEIVFFKR